MRERKTDDQQDWDKYLDEAKWDYPTASPERLNAVVFKKLSEKKHSIPPPIDPELTLRPQINRKSEILS